ncbi:tripartite-type tricarboxylate transporter receptor subunit TctC [Paralcaligenes ureilyticus]|uniref:Tripartite-type tricarboxylate transporter receptor subunit TctC n=2 Tax=Paralcaligenes ureilyticus TaxID=627131 RepID=A0A4R3M895_9BURK|nr:tripartite-type tricarboxylate transporter receptor subunit TctC [Paralcaligenes ureilyticus]
MVLNKKISGIAKALTAAVVVSGGLGLSAGAMAAYPDHPIRMIVGFSAGGTTDVVARIVAKEISQELGQSVVVDNRPGAGSNIGTEMAARAQPDGYTLYMVAVTSAINQTLYKNIHFNLIKDFAPVALAAKVPNVLVVNPQLPVHSVKELVAYAKAHPGKLNFASSGTGTSIHMAGELFKQSAGIDVLHVPYKGSAPALTDLMGGQVQYMFDNMPSAWPHVQAGKLRALAVTTGDRSKTAPDLPTMQESGFPGFDVSSWFGVLAPKGTPAAVVDKLNAAIEKGLYKSDVQARLKGLGAVTVKTTPAEFGEFIQSEVVNWAKVVKASGVTVD